MIPNENRRAAHNGVAKIKVTIMSFEQNNCQQIVSRYNSWQPLPSVKQFTIS